MSKKKVQKSEYSLDLICVKWLNDDVIDSRCSFEGENMPRRSLYKVLTVKVSELVNSSFFSCGKSICKISSNSEIVGGLGFYMR